MIYSVKKNQNKNKKTPPKPKAKGFCSFVIAQKPFKKLAFDSSDDLRLKNEPNQEPF